MQVFLNSEHADVTNSKGDCIFYLNRAISVPKDVDVHVGVVSFDVPNTEYTINSSNNTIVVNLNEAGNNTRTIPNGTYTTNSLVNALDDAAVLGADSIVSSYDSTTSKFSFTHATLDYVFDSTSTALYTLGFVSETSYSSTATDLTAPNPCDLSGTKNIYISSQLALDNIHCLSSGHGRNTNILAKAQINVDTDAMLFYGSSDPIMTRTGTKQINYLHIKLLGDDATTVYNPDLFWSLALKLDFYELVHDESRTRRLV
ncbi:unnamed protein product [Heterosigma akashiwo]